MNRNRFIVYILFIVSLCAVNITTYSAVIRVPADQPTIQAGINAANEGDTVLVADGIYKGEGNTNINFIGKQITLKSQNGANNTIIDCEVKPETRGITFDNQETDATVLDGFTIKNGLHEKGGGIYCDFASPTIKNCIITENQAGDPANYSGQGGGIYCYNSSPVIEVCRITHNQVGSQFGGGGVFLTGEWVGQDSKPKPILINCTISDNIGSGIDSRGRVTVEIKGCTVSNNSGRGVICTANYSLEKNLITNSRIEQNNDGGIEVSEETALKITESVIRQNTSRSGAGIKCSRTCTLDISECIIAENSATRLGGGLNIDSWYGQVTISHSTITQNTSVQSAGGIFFSGLPSIQLRLTISNSIVWGNKSEGKTDEISAWGNQVVIKSSNIGGGLNGLGRVADGQKLIYEDNINKDPLFVDAENGDYRLKLNSPAAGMGPQSTVGGSLSVAPVGKKLIKWGELKRK